MIKLNIRCATALFFLLVSSAYGAGVVGDGPTPPPPAPTASYGTLLTFQGNSYYKATPSFLYSNADGIAWAAVSFTLDYCHNYGKNLCVLRSVEEKRVRATTQAFNVTFHVTMASIDAYTDLVRTEKDYTETVGATAAQLKVWNTKGACQYRALQAALSACYNEAHVFCVIESNTIQPASGKPSRGSCTSLVRGYDFSN